MTYICSHCHWGYMLEHGIKYVKCPICGYTKELTKEEARENMLIFFSDKEKADDGSKD